ncbi:acetolactate synthase small subunit [Brevibacillus dissolubilis]|uniref:acetolactate synthase small subunit n=1 Tax=Brevibacillus dissolubilis TaxID=1844116 RepID=UPI00159BD87B|nr:acetolactate synthase small subunit [Brevibacillus dissolubilis]
MEHTFLLTVNNHPATFLRVMGVYSRRGLLIDSMTINRGAAPDVSDVSITVQCDSRMAENLIKQLEKQMDVIQVRNGSDKSLAS